MAAFDKYDGQWTITQAAHLLRRTTYGSDLSIIKDFASQGLENCLQILFQQLPLPAPPINYNYDSDPDVPIGETWVDKNTSANVNGYRTASLRSWSIEQLIGSKNNIREKMTMFWHNHFVTADINDPRFSYVYINLLRKSALGNFKQLTKDITIDIAMLNYLNGRDNTRQAPNENYARELMELFTLGKGEQVGSGDYTTFTELDVKEMAKALTGWIDVRNTLPLRAEFRANRHDTTVKTLSHRFNNISISNANENEYKNVIDILFQRTEVAEFIATKIYRWFVHYDVTDEIITDIIKPMAALIRNSDYEISGALQSLLGSQHFYDVCVMGRMVKNPIDFILGPLSQFDITLPADPVLKQRVLVGLYGSMNVQQMAIFQAPSVAGWTPYYQAPNFYRLWLNSTSLPSRKVYTDAISSVGINYNGYRLIIDPLPIILQTQTPSDASSIISELETLLFAFPVASNQHVTLVAILNNNNVGNSWQTLYANYIAAPTNEQARQALVTRIKLVITYMMRMPEIHLS